VDWLPFVELLKDKRMKKFPQVFAACILALSLAPMFALAGSDQPVLELLPVEARAIVGEKLAKAGENASNLSGAITEAPAEQREAVAFLIANMPVSDLKTLGKDYLLANVKYAYLAREATSWGRNIPKELFFEEVLPYASINERRDDWRKDFYDRFLPIAKECASPGETVRRLNVEVFKTFNVAYHATKRPKPDQSPYESIQAGFASCTGLSILLIDAARAVGIPARMVGTPRWTDNSGNHSWVEIWDREWSFVGACEPSKLNESWFLDKASKADETKPNNRIYATSFKTSETYFPMVWKRTSKDVPAEDVTRRYTLRRKVTFKAPGTPGEITVRFGGRLVAQDKIADTTTFELPGDLSYEVIVARPEGAIKKTIKLSTEANQVVEIQ
jgi:Transglutaminase-like superfamily